MSAKKNDVADWWRTAIIEMAPGRIHIRGRPIEGLIGNMGFAQMVWLMTRGAPPSEGQARLLECALVAAVDHGPQSPAIAAARMAATCGLGLNGAMASAVNMLDDVHGGAGEQAVEFFHSVDEAARGGEKTDLENAAAAAIEQWQKKRGKYVPGFGHRFHKPEDPRVPRLLQLADEAAAAGVVGGRFADIARAAQKTLGARRGAPPPLNIDGATAVIYAELGFAPPLARGLFCLSRSVGIIAHAWEQMNEGGRVKGPTPPQYRWTYDGENPMDGKGGGGC